MKAGSQIVAQQGVVHGTERDQRFLVASPLSELDGNMAGLFEGLPAGRFDSWTSRSGNVQRVALHPARTLT